MNPHDQHYVMIPDSCLEDVIRVVGYCNESPMVEFKYRPEYVLSLTEEKITEDQVISAVREFERISGIQLTDFCAYPDHPGAADRAEECGRIMDETLCRVNLTYEELKANSGRPRIVFLRQQAFRRFKERRMKDQHVSENQLKSIRVLTNPQYARFLRKTGNRNPGENDLNCKKVFVQSHH